MAFAGVPTLEKHASHFVSAIPHTPRGRYASVILLRETKTYAIFTTEGGEQQDVERTRAGLSHNGRVDRLVMFKRKQVAPERRAGKALLRQAGVFPYAHFTQQRRSTAIVYDVEEISKAIIQHKPKQVEYTPEKAERPQKIVETTRDLAERKDDIGANVVLDCYLTEGLCTHCPDCLTYGYAAIEGEGARKARVMTDSCFSIRPHPFIQRLIKFNVIDEQEQTSGTITEYDYTQPEIILPTVITTVDLTCDEFVYVLGNVLRTTRYGKESSRQGFMRNHVLAIAFSDVELFANLELTQALYDALTSQVKLDNGSSLDPVRLEDGLSLDDTKRRVPHVLQELTQSIFGRITWVRGDELNEVLSEVQSLYQDEARLYAFLRELNTMTASFAS
jgi:CRISPR-associated protein Csc2